MADEAGVSRTLFHPFDGLEIRLNHYDEVELLQRPPTGDPQCICIPIRLLDEVFSMIRDRVQEG